MLHWTLPKTLLAASGAMPFGQLLPIILMFAVVYLLVLRPMSNQEKTRRKRVEQLKKGDAVVLAGGIMGRISNLDDPKIAVIEIADRVKIRVLKREIMDTQEAALKEETKGGGLFGGAKANAGAPAAKTSDKDKKEDTAASADKASS